MARYSADGYAEHYHWVDSRLGTCFGRDGTDSVYLCRILPATVDPDEVAVGSIIVVQPGEKVPLDGVVESGNASLNTSALTGESLPRDVKEGDEIISGCINLNGVLKIRTTKEFGESTVSKILDLVENASSRKSRSEAFISRFAKIYTPAVCISAVLLGIAVPLLRMVFGMDAAWVDWIYQIGRAHV